MTEIKPGLTECVVFGSEGVVGKATRRVLRHLGFSIIRVDPKVDKSIGINLKDNKLTKESVKDIENTVFIICVPTDIVDNTGVLDITCILNIIQNITNTFGSNANIVIRSTLTGNSFKIIKRLCTNVCYIPEFLSEKTSLYDTVFPDRILIGCNPDNCMLSEYISWYILRVLEKYYYNNPDNRNKCKIRNISIPLFYMMNFKDVELIKLFQNVYAANKVILFNVFKIICEKFGCDWNEVHLGLTTSKFIEKTHTQVPGHDGHLGFGGKCLPKDTLNLLVEYGNLNRIYAIPNGEKNKEVHLRNDIIDYLNLILSLNNKIRKE